MNCVDDPNPFAGLPKRGKRAIETEDRQKTLRDEFFVKAPPPPPIKRKKPSK